MSLLSNLKHVLEVEWKHTYKSARKDGWSRRYSWSLFVVQFFYGVVEEIEIREEKKRDRWSLRRIRER